MAITYLLVNPKFDVRGIISAHAPTISPPAGQTSYRILLDVVENRLGMASHPLPTQGDAPRGTASEEKEGQLPISEPA